MRTIQNHLPVRPWKANEACEVWPFCGAGMRRSEAEVRSPQAIAKRCASTRARATRLGVSDAAPDGFSTKNSEEPNM